MRPPAVRVADSRDLIRVHGARVNNLKDVSVVIPKRRPTVFCGPFPEGLPARKTRLNPSVAAASGPPVPHQ